MRSELTRERLQTGLHGALLPSQPPAGSQRVYGAGKGSWEGAQGSPTLPGGPKHRHKTLTHHTCPSLTLPSPSSVGGVLKVILDKIDLDS